MIPEKIKKSIGNIEDNIEEKYRSSSLSGLQDLVWSGREDLNLRSHILIEFSTADARRFTLHPIKFIARSIL